FFAKTHLEVEGERLHNRFYVDPKLGHELIASVYRERSRSDVAEGTLDDYGYIYMVHHLAEARTAPLKDIEAVLTPNFLRAKVKRLGRERYALDDLRIAVKAAAGVQDALRSVMWAWVYVGYRDRIATKLLPDAIALLVYLGLTDAVRDGIYALD